MNDNNRVVLDTNVLVSALVFGGTPRKVTDLVGLGVIVPVVAEENMTELRRIIRSKFPDFLPYLQQLEQLLRRYGDWVQLGAFEVRASRDHDDDKFIETALTGRCRYIVSGDRDLLDLCSYEDIKILSPAEFLREFLQR